MDVLDTDSADSPRPFPRNILPQCARVSNVSHLSLFANSSMQCPKLINDSLLDGRGYLGPGGLDLETNATLAEHCIGGAAGYIDIKIFTNKHIYNWATTKSVFKSGNYDPEGFLGTLTSVVQVWFGVQTGATMVVYPRHVSRLKRWTIWAILMGVTGTILCQAKMTGGWIPINKNLW